MVKSLAPDHTFSFNVLSCSQIKDGRQLKVKCLFLGVVGYVIIFALNRGELQSSNFIQRKFVAPIIFQGVAIVLRSFLFTF